MTSSDDAVAVNEYLSEDKPASLYERLAGAESVAREVAAVGLPSEYADKLLLAA